MRMSIFLTEMTSAQDKQFGYFIQIIQQETETDGFQIKLTTVLFLLEISFTQTQMDSKK